MPFRAAPATTRWWWAARLPLNLDGGSGIDTVNLDALGNTIDLSGVNSSRFTAIEKIDLAGSGANTLVLDKQAVLDMAGTNGDAFDDNTLLIKGDAVDRVSLARWLDARERQMVNPAGEIGSFVSYTDGAARLLIESEVQVQVFSGTIDLATLTAARRLPHLRHRAQTTAPAGRSRRPGT